MRFVKMQGAGNDFVLVDGREGEAADWPALARAMSDRHFGIGADGLLLVQASDHADARMVMWNPDGSESEMCGNGLRCFARLVLDLAGNSTSRLSVETGAGVLNVAPSAIQPGWLETSLGTPFLEAGAIPVDAPAGVTRDLELPPLDVRVTCVSMGNPHAVRLVPDIDAVDLAVEGPQVERHEFFPRRTNYHLCQVLAHDRVRMRSWERGAGLTMACGTGAAATVVAARLHDLVGETVLVDVPGGQLAVTYPGVGEVRLAGPAEYVFEGDWPA